MSQTIHSGSAANSSRMNSWDSLGFHLRELAENLDSKGFQALSPGLGIGELKPHEKRAIPEQTPAMREGAAVNVGASYPTSDLAASAQNPGPRFASSPVAQLSPSAVRQEVEDKPGSAKGSKTVRRLSWMARFIKRCYAWSIDLSLVVASLGLALVCAAAALSFGEGQEDFWYEGGPLSWILKFELWEMALIVGGVFTMYFGTFRLIAGRTFGESLAGVLGKNHPVSAQGPVVKGRVISRH